MKIATARPMQLRYLTLGWLLSGTVLVAACSDGSDSSTEPASSGGTSSVGGNSAPGGTSSVGGNSAPGGTSSVGGNSATGGAAAVGGNSAPGGTSSVGGNSATGGAAAVGGNSATSTDRITELTASCKNSGGEVVSQQCCTAAEDFPRECGAIGTCTCAPAYLEPTLLCKCSTGCFDGTKCVTP